MIVAMAGLPGVGKSTLACALSTRLRAVVLDKDRIRAGLFPPSHMDYTHDQNDFCVDVMYRTTDWLLRRDHALVVILDGCTYTRANQIATLRQVAADLAEPLRVIECTCDDQVALARIAGDANHPAGNRDAALYRKLQAAAQAITGPKLVVDTGRPNRRNSGPTIDYVTALAELRDREINYDPSEVRPPDWNFDVYRSLVGREQTNRRRCGCGPTRPSSTILSAAK